MYVADTIAAISTALGESAIGIVRLSGEDAIKIANSIYQGKDLSQVDSHTIHYGHIIKPQTAQIVDEVMVSVMRAPRTYTRENVVEINCHGGVVAVQRILEATLDAGARLAEPGEFSKRAFLNGRIDLSQAEAVMDLIQAKTNKAMDASLDQLQGSLSHKITSLRQRMLDTLAQVEVTIDYPEYDDVEELSTQELQQTAELVQKEIQAIMHQAQSGRLFREGIQTAIIGRPNVGKSSLLNALTGFEKAIVTNIEGTTRDTIEEYVNVRGVPLKLIDTAGIRQSDDIVEQIGVEKSKKAMDAADLIILLLNQAEALTDTDRELLELTKDQTRIILLNKQDLAPVLKLDDLRPYADQEEIIQTSMLNESGLDALEAQIETKFFSGNIESKDVNYLLNTRHTQLLKQAIQALTEVLEGTELGLPVDLIQIDFTRAWDLLGEITGESVQDELIDKLFSQFCLGK
ncbi:tRNA uridine-5-carboxymethylaminomethyl(34) synthesis GTPase MnmE [Suicoccus acidiformans]|uniref:tRNA modification GTPase MnmE n=1 Tax=Suicoccus acidiformans TaxID=2036206 RepID=A0A347WHI9_9LACT|nr:tRNA uridine-5-carboxymethylaminomethyl(34) synthesis GTPase MnmE [Suicoccus acidiformans]AXY24546.1 tRNA uridine-5-carboxymethylaminomethyl(34) synthesis GTPase MnmE [Suicoccus acidiformans]